MISITQSRYLFLVEKAAALLLLIYPTLMLVVKGGMNGVFFVNAADFLCSIDNTPDRYEPSGVAARMGDLFSGHACHVSRNFH